MKAYRTFMTIIWLACAFGFGHDIGIHEPHNFWFWFDAFICIIGTLTIIGWTRESA